ncbi:TrmB family transcriptional regulator [Halocatena marina]|uniref:TrmB family transcriptional regulator n=1 Tax=Halocatena marina TaxID=2934937 RepID=UPI00200D6C52|nr:TrmB family transcriptional regulator sugar-binding domain-containing protein [Halocatena marina]
MDESEITRRLRQFGFSEKEIDTYFTILAHGEAKAATIAENAGVSKRYVYSISETLEERGFVEVNDHIVPTTIRANPPEEVIARLTEELQAMQPGLESRFNRTTQPTQQFEVVKSRVTVLKRIQQLLSRATEEVTLSVPVSLLPKIEDELRATVDRGVLVLLLVTREDLEDGQIDQFDDIASAVRVWEELAPVLLTIDRQQGIVAPNEMLMRANTGKQAIVVAQQQLVPVFVGSFLGNYWPMADEVCVTESASLPHRYDGFRQAVLHAELHRRAGQPLVAQIQARSTDSNDDYHDITGPIVEIRQSLTQPATNSFPVENALVVETDDGLVSVGGPGAFIEEYEAGEITLVAGEE